MIGFRCSLTGTVAKRNRLVIVLILSLCQHAASFSPNLTWLVVKSATTTSAFPWCLASASRGDDDSDDEEFNVSASSSSSSASNVLGTTLQCCCANVGESGIGTGFYRNGYCSTGEQDLGRHTVCVQVTDDFLQFSAAVGNDLSTPIPEYMFPGLRTGDIWCLCAQRWAQAYKAGKAPKLFLQATHEKTLDFVPFEILRQYALDQEEADRNLEDLNDQREKLKKLL